MADALRFSAWKPSARDRSIGYSYVVGSGRGARKISPGRDSWERAKRNVAASALYSGVEEYKVWGGIGDHRWRRTILVSQEEAEAFLRADAEGDATAQAALEQALLLRDRRLAREAART